MINIRYKGNIIISGVAKADNFWTRLSGYMFKKKPHYPGILFLPAISIHTFFMHFCLDVIFIDKEGKILKIYRNMQPWRHTWFYFRATTTLELPSGHLPGEIGEGEKLEIEYV